MSTKAYEGTYNGEQAIWLQAGRYEAVVLPEVGANLIAFRDIEKEYRFLREPAMEEMEAFKERPIVHGIPVLFPPNRYEDGKFPWKGKVFQFPVNEPKTGNHLHGFVHNIPWAVENFSADEQGSRVSLALRVREGHSVHEFLPFDFTIRLSYTLNEQGLHQQISVHNDGQEAMPCLLAFHTTINAPFAVNSQPSDYSFQMTIGERWALNDRMLPTGEYQALSADEEKMKVGGLSPFFEGMDNHYTSVPQNSRNFMALTDAREGIKLVYDVGTSYKQWMIWNNGKTEGFFCPEPQMNLVNAPNVDLPADQIGLVSLEPGEVWEETARLYTIQVAK
ncbi:aldose epimerase [Paenibacillus pectinilyticus]|uniref:Aldose epimerase n=1 Tax=Paenibacillus pectinilyticus TaxID=512399 RepID=A0A1C1A1R3_9BACL|nr:aldose 1-epimerase [Paenibacillus pectinilyticus]OCT14458.1 aldose epimerase [Paenibacillus pectinilyticus]